jgi:hypothetical protein
LLIYPLPRYCFSFHKSIIFNFCLFQNPAKYKLITNTHIPFSKLFHNFLQLNPRNITTHSYYQPFSNIHLQKSFLTPPSPSPLSSSLPAGGIEWLRGYRVSPRVVSGWITMALNLLRCLGVVVQVVRLALLCSLVIYNFFYPLIKSGRLRSYLCNTYCFCKVMSI